MTHDSAIDVFSNALLDPDIAASDVPTLRRQPDDEGRLSIYRNNVVVGITEALSASFPVTAAIVGDEFFAAMVRERLRVAPPNSPVLTEYAAGFPAFIRAFPYAASLPYLSDVAQIETFRIEAYHEADTEPLAREAYRLIAASPEALARTRVRLAPACRWLRCEYAAYSVWAAHTGLDDFRDADLSGIDIERPEDVLIVRPVFDPVVFLLPAGGYEFLTCLSIGETLQSALSRASEASPAYDPVALLSLLIEHDLAVSFSHDEAQSCQ